MGSMFHLYRKLHWRAFSGEFHVELEVNEFVTLSM